MTGKFFRNLKFVGHKKSATASVRKYRRMAPRISMDTLEPNSIIILSLQSPKEKLWGALTSINSAGVTVRGIDLNSFDDFIRQVMDPDGERIGLPTLFFPMQRVERIALDEPHGSIPSMAGRFEQRVGRSLRDYLALFV
jgi:hypothetical protein